MPVTKDRCRSIHLDVVCGPVSAETGALLLHSLVKHFLYMRGQLPDLYDELCWQLQVRSFMLVSPYPGQSQAPGFAQTAVFLEKEKNQEDATPATPQTRKRLSHAEKRLVKVSCSPSSAPGSGGRFQAKRHSTDNGAVQTLTSVEDMLRCLTPDMLARQDVWWISLLFGPTPQSPHEVYDVVLETQGTQSCVPYCLSKSLLLCWMQKQGCGLQDASIVRCLRKKTRRDGPASLKLPRNELTGLPRRSSAH